MSSSVLKYETTSVAVYHPNSWPQRHLATTTLN